MVRGGGTSWNGRREGKVGVSMGDMIWKKEKDVPLFLSLDEHHRIMYYYIPSIPR